jgi:hypothetical protein
MSDSNTDAEREARRIIERVNAETDISAGIVTRSAFQRAPQADKDDWIERTGTRIGRAASVVLFFGLLIWLAISLFGLGETP